MPIWASYVRPFPRTSSYIYARPRPATHPSEPCWSCESQAGRLHSFCTRGASPAPANTLLSPLLDYPSAFIPFRFFFIVSLCDLFSAVCIFVWAHLFIHSFHLLSRSLLCFKSTKLILILSRPFVRVSALIYFAPTTLIAQQASRSHAGPIYYSSLIIAIIAIVEHTSAFCFTIFIISFLILKPQTQSPLFSFLAL